MSLKGKIVFITGASSGIGAATALAFASQGVRLLLAARRAGKLAQVGSLALERGAASGPAKTPTTRPPPGGPKTAVRSTTPAPSPARENLKMGKIEDWDEMID